MQWGIDYWENILIPLDNMISRGTETFLTSRDPDYLASAFTMVQQSLANEDYGEREVVPAAKLLEVILQVWVAVWSGWRDREARRLAISTPILPWCQTQVCRGRVDHYVGPILQLVLSKLGSAKKRTLKVSARPPRPPRGCQCRIFMFVLRCVRQDALVMVVADALYYNAPLTLSLLQSQGALASFLGLWFGLIFASKKSGKGKHFRRMHDKKVWGILKNGRKCKAPNI